MVELQMYDDCAYEKQNIWVVTIDIELLRPSLYVYLSADFVLTRMNQAWNSTKARMLDDISWNKMNPSQTNVLSSFLHCIMPY